MSRTASDVRLREMAGTWSDVETALRRVSGEEASARVPGSALARLIKQLAYQHGRALFQQWLRTRFADLNVLDESVVMDSLWAWVDAEGGFDAEGFLAGLEEIAHALPAHTPDACAATALARFICVERASMPETPKRPELPATQNWTRFIIDRRASPGAAPDALQRLAEFQPPASPHAGMGFRNDALWFHVPVAVPISSSGRWVLEIDYALLNRTEVFIAREGHAEQVATMGSLLPFRDRPLGSRTPAVMLDLQPAQKVDILFRVDTRSSVIVPVKFLKPAAFHARANHEFLLQGILIAIGLCLLVFSLQQWINLKDAVYGKYAAVIVCHLLFSMHLFGLGAIYLWTDRPWIEVHMAGLSLLMVSATLSLFVEAVLADDLHPRARLALKVLAAVLVLFALLFALDLMNNRWLGVVSAVFGLMPALIGLQGAIARVRRGDNVGTYFIVAWAGYFLTGVILFLTINGHIGANFWTLHALQFGATFDMLLFMRIVTLRTAAEHRVAQHARHERDMMKSLAHTDSLTVLKNRRGLNEALAALVPHATAERLLAIYMLDLDGFKPVNDQYGHDVGDELLVAIGARLTAAVRTQDIVARVGGDEFVIVATEVTSEATATDLGNKLLAAFQTPFKQGEHDCHVGVTIGYVLVPQDGTQITALLKAADAAMYAGKQLGKSIVVRGVM